MKTLTLPLAAIATALALTANVSAQRPDRDTATEHRTEDATLAEWLVDKDARLSELVGRRVINSDGTDLGEVEDLVASPKADEEPVVVLSIGGVLDIGDKRYATSFEELRIAGGGEKLVLDKTEQELEAAPEFHYLPMHGEQSPLPGVSGPSTTNSIGRLLGATVVDGRDESIGEIEDFVVSTGKAGTRAVVGLDDAAGNDVDGRLVAIPFDDLHIELSGEEAVAIPQQARVRVELGGTPVEALPVYEYDEPDAI